MMDVCTYFARLGGNSSSPAPEFIPRMLPFDVLAVFECIPVGNPIFLALWFYLSTALLCVFYFGRGWKKRQRIQFFIPDFWAATLSLFPVFALLARTVNIENPVFGLHQTLLIVVSFHAVVAGIWAALILACPLKEKPLPRHRDHFLAVLSGGFLGLMAVLYFALYFHFALAADTCAVAVVQLLVRLVCLFVYLCYLYPPLLGPTFFVIFLAKKMNDHY